MFYCYVLRSEKTGRRYVGSCENLADRIHRHNAGESKATKHGTPLVLIHSESFASRSEAAQREQYYKTGRGRDELGKLRRAVAAATSRGFKSHQPDELPPSQNVLLLRIAQREDQTTLLGSCENLADRISRHNAGESKATKHGIPWILIHTKYPNPKKQAFGTNAYTL